MSRLTPDVLRDHFFGKGFESFIETGTAWGDSTTAALESAVFADVQTVEIDGDMYQLVCSRFAGRRIRCHRGRSVDKLPRIIDEAKKTLFWLDAHYSGGGPGAQISADHQCDLIMELFCINTRSWRERPTIWIDDAHMFTPLVGLLAGHGFDPARWPTLDSIRETLGPAWSIELLTIGGGLVLACTPLPEVPGE